MANRPYKQYTANKIQINVERNEFIKAAKFLVVDQDGTNLGLLDKDVAIAKAKAQDLDLVMVAPTAVPPVARILAWEKYKYQLTKKEKEKRGKNVSVKEVWFYSFMGQPDFERKLKLVINFLSKEGRPVKITLKSHRRRKDGGINYRVGMDQMNQMMRDILKRLEGHITEARETPKFMNRNLVLFVVPSKKNASEVSK